jgi:hypothetical protein
VSRPGRILPPEKARYPLYRRLGGPQGRSGQVRKIPTVPGFDCRTVQPVGSHYTDWATGPPLIIQYNTLFIRWINTASIASEKAKYITQGNGPLTCTNSQCAFRVTTHISATLFIYYTIHPISKFYQYIANPEQYKLCMAFSLSGAENALPEMWTPIVGWVVLNIFKDYCAFVFDIQNL